MSPKLERLRRSIDAGLADLDRGNISSILRTSEERHGRDARTRYSALLLAAMRRVAEDPEGRSTSDRTELRPGIGTSTSATAGRKPRGTGREPARNDRAACAGHPKAAPILSAVGAERHEVI
jgi:hypothetical protein